MPSGGGGPSSTGLYDPYGAPEETSGEERASLGFQGDYTDADTGLVDMGARLYHPALARFQSQDPLFGDANRPTSLNQYGYAEGNPVTWDDPTGLVIPPGCSVKDGCPGPADTKKDEPGGLDEGGGGGGDGGGGTEYGGDGSPGEADPVGTVLPRWRIQAIARFANLEFVFSAKPRQMLTLAEYGGWSLFGDIGTGEDQLPGIFNVDGFEALEQMATSVRAEYRGGLPKRATVRFELSSGAFQGLTCPFCTVTRGSATLISTRSKVQAAWRFQVVDSVTNESRTLALRVEARSTPYQETPHGQASYRQAPSGYRVNRAYEAGALAGFNPRTPFDYLFRLGRIATGVTPYNSASWLPQRTVPSNRRGV